MSLYLPTKYLYFIITIAILLLLWNFIIEFLIINNLNKFCVWNIVFYNQISTFLSMKRQKVFGIPSLYHLLNLKEYFINLFDGLFFFSSYSKFCHKFLKISINYDAKKGNQYWEKQQLLYLFFFNCLIESF